MLISCLELVLLTLALVNQKRMQAPSYPAVVALVILFVVVSE
jgi:hypothetical protein